MSLYFHNSLHNTKFVLTEKNENEYFKKRYSLRLFFYFYILKMNSFELVLCAMVIRHSSIVFQIKR